MKHKNPLGAISLCTIIGCILFSVSNPIANRYRPIPGAGGELLFIIFPHILWFAIIPMIRDIFNDHQNDP